MELTHVTYIIIYIYIYIYICLEHFVQSEVAFGGDS